MSRFTDHFKTFTALLNEDTVWRLIDDDIRPFDTYPDPVHAWQADMHYQRGQLGTRHKSPNFF